MRGKGIAALLAISLVASACGDNGTGGAPTAMPAPTNPAARIFVILRASP